jgi:ABC-type polysaccharide/polyol phosphate export permease
MLGEFRELIRYRELLLTLIIRDIKVRYKNSVGGFLWSLMNPLFQVAAMTFAFRRIMNVDVPNYSAYLLCAFLPWTFFQMSVLDSAQSVLLHYALVKKTYFPREILPISVVLSNLVHFILALVIYFFYLVILQAPVALHAHAPSALTYISILWSPIHKSWLLLPVIVVIQFFLNLGVAFFVSCLNVFYEDVKYLVTVLLNFLLFTLPIFYLIERVQLASIPAWFRPFLLKLYFVNPLSYLITAYRKILLPPVNTATVHNIPLSYGYLGLAALTSMLICLAGYAFFNSRKWSFAERM